jgi:hypothetical protein
MLLHCSSRSLCCILLQDSPGLHQLLLVVCLQFC